MSLKVFPSRLNERDVIVDVEWRQRRHRRHLPDRLAHFLPTDNVKVYGLTGFELAIGTKLCHTMWPVTPKALKAMG